MLSTIFKKTLDARLVFSVGIFVLSFFIVAPNVYASDNMVVEYPTVDPGEAEIGMRMIALYDNNPNINNAQTRKLGAGYGITSDWSSELTAEYAKAADSSTVQVQSYEWENLLRLNQPGMSWANWAVIVEYTYSVDRNTQNAIKLTPIMQTRSKDAIVTLNFGFDRNPSENGTNRWQFSYGWQYLLRGDPALQFAFEGFGQMGDVSHWSSVPEQSQQIGPALIGKINSDEDTDLVYRVGLFFGLTRTTPNRALTASMEYEF